MATTSTTSATQSSTIYSSTSSASRCANTGGSCVDAVLEVDCSRWPKHFFNRTDPPWPLTALPQRQFRWYNFERNVWKGTWKWPTNQWKIIYIYYFTDICSNMLAQIDYYFHLNLNYNLSIAWNSSWIVAGKQKIGTITDFSHRTNTVRCAPRFEVYVLCVTFWSLRCAPRFDVPTSW